MKNGIIKAKRSSTHVPRDLRLILPRIDKVIHGLIKVSAKHLSEVTIVKGVMLEPNIFIKWLNQTRWAAFVRQ